MCDNDQASDRMQPLHEYIQRVVDEAPPHSKAQRAQLAALLRGASQQTGKGAERGTGRGPVNDHLERGKSVRACVREG